MLQSFNKPVCAVVNQKSLGKELVVMGDQKLDIYNFASSQWRIGPPTTLVSCAFDKKNSHWVDMSNLRVMKDSFMLVMFPLVLSVYEKKIYLIGTAIIFAHPSSCRL